MTTTGLAIVTAGVTLVAIVGMLLVRRHAAEHFSLGNIIHKVVDVGKDVGKGAANVGKGVYAMAQGNGGGGGGGPTYVGRRWDGADWSCPDGTVDTGQDDAHACLTSQFTNPQWRWDGRQWGWSCPNGTTPTGKSDWTSQCEVGYQSRVLIGGSWVCPSGSTDTGANWDNSDWAGAQKQCRRTTAYGQRMWDGTQWTCPPGTTDTKRNWDSPVGGANQCKYNAG